MIKHLKIPLGKFTPSGVPEPQALAKTMTSGGSRVPWTKHPLDDTSLGHGVPDQFVLPQDRIGILLTLPSKRTVFPNVSGPIAQGNLVSGTHHPRDASSEGRLVQGTASTRVASSNPWNASSEIFHSGAHRSGTK
jgi:hypothetical protein